MTEKRPLASDFHPDAQQRFERALRGAFKVEHHPKPKGRKKPNARASRASAKSEQPES